jgi:hypothetical protein
MTQESPAATSVAKRKPPAAGSGRKRGVPNRLTKSAKEAFELAFDGLGGVAGLIAWGERHRTAFYRLYARLIPPGSLTGPLVNITLPSTAGGQQQLSPEQAYRLMCEGAIPLDPHHAAFRTTRPAIEAAPADDSFHTEAQNQ